VRLGVVSLQLESFSLLRKIALKKNKFLKIKGKKKILSLLGLELTATPTETAL